jgi:hypothetical protein
MAIRGRRCRSSAGGDPREGQKGGRALPDPHVVGGSAYDRSEKNLERMEVERVRATGESRSTSVWIRDVEGGSDGARLGMNRIAGDVG